MGFPPGPSTPTLVLHRVSRARSSQRFLVQDPLKSSTQSRRVVEAALHGALDMVGTAAGAGAGFFGAGVQDSWLHLWGEQHWVEASRRAFLGTTRVLAFQLRHLPLRLWRLM